MTSRSLRWFLAAAVALSVVWNTPPPVLAAESATARIVGFATYRERIAMPRGAVFEAALEAEDQWDASGETIARVHDEDPGQVPIAFEIPFDPRRVDPEGRYVIRASIYVAGRLRFSGTETYRGAAQDRDRITVLMRSVSAEESDQDRDRNRDRDGDREGDRDRDEERDRGPAPGERGAEARLGIPATFSGVVPCLDCDGVRHQINLLPGRAFMQSMTYFREGHDETVYELGEWSLSRDGGTITLEGKERSSWSVRNRRTIRRLESSGRRTDSRQPYDLTRRTQFDPMEPRLALTGMFRYLADAPRFRDCGSGLQWPVAMSNDYRALERAYRDRRDRRGRPGSELLVSLQARIEERMNMEGSGVEPFLVVEHFVRAMPGEDCEEPGGGNAGIADTRWRPVRIGDRPVVVTGRAREPWILLEPRSNRASGFGGCNGISGTYESRGQALRFGPMIRTQMACPALDTENAFVRALEATRRYRLRDPRTLELLDVNGRLLAVLEERNLR
jgi:uncharacterized lipoprotein YbaY/heat shock protein HslJ/uncharacterized lipoprotein NlpE involved in copper resistance